MLFRYDGKQDKPSLEEGVTGKILKFADDTKLFTQTKEIGDLKKIA